VVAAGTVVAVGMEVELAPGAIIALEVAPGAPVVVAAVVEAAAAAAVVAAAAARPCTAAAATAAARSCTVATPRRLEVGGACTAVAAWAGGGR